MIRIHKIERKHSFGAENRCWEPIVTHQLSIVFENPAFSTLAEANADSLMTRQVNDEYLPSFGGNRAVISSVSEAKDQAETLEGYAFEKAVRPDLKLLFM